jgi:transcriptional regulator with XRE-family HTH domain
LTAKEFGLYLKELRETRKLTIRQVEIQAHISNAYLSLLENGKRGIPKPTILKKLAPVYKISYEKLMIAAGHISQSNQNNTDLDLSVPDKFIKEYEKLSPEDREKVAKELFSRILESKRER